MLQVLRALWFVVFTFIGLLLLGAGFWRGLIATLALLALRVTPVPPVVVYALGAVVFALGLVQWSTGLLR